MVALALLAGAPAPAGADAAPGPASLGVATWWGCMESGPFDGPRPLACPRPYDARYARVVGGPPQVFDVLVAENEMKMPWLQPSRGRFDFRVADRMARFAAERGLTIRGHALVFGKFLPGWMVIPRLPAWTRETLLAELRRHVFTVMRHYRDNFPGVVRTWDVVNEAFAADGSYERTLLLEVIGPDYIELMFRYAREADPGARLLFNEFAADQPNARQQAVLRMARDFRERDVPLDAIGMQMHIGMDGNLPTSEQRREVMRAYGELGLEVEVTELDVGFPPTLDGRDRSAEQAQIYREVAADCAAEPACAGVTVWGVADHHSWRGSQGRMLLHDEQYRPKPVLDEVVRTLSRGRSRATLLRRPPGPGVVARSRHRRRTIVGRGLRARVSCPAGPPCRVTLSLAVQAGTGYVTVARTRYAVSGAGRTVRLRPTRLGARRIRALSRSRRARLRASVTGSPVTSKGLRITLP